MGHKGGTCIGQRKRWLEPIEEIRKATAGLRGGDHGALGVATILGILALGVYTLFVSKQTTIFR